MDALQCLFAPEFEVVGTAGDGRTLVEIACRLRPDLVLSEVTLPLLNGVEAAIRLKKRLPQTHVLFVTKHSDREHLHEALRAGASGYLLKNCTGEEIIAAIHEILSGRCYITPGMTRDLFSAVRQGVPNPQSPALTVRQREILQLVAEGHSLKDISAMLNISRKTVEYHKYGLMRSLNVRTTAELIQYALTVGLLANSRSRTAKHGDS
jgi:DNA-binding NarL/FixJ family response regulator